MIHSVRCSDSTGPEGRRAGPQKSNRETDPNFLPLLRIFTFNSHQLPRYPYLHRPLRWTQVLAQDPSHQARRGRSHLWSQRIRYGRVSVGGGRGCSWQASSMEALVGRYVNEPCARTSTCSRILVQSDFLSFPYIVPFLSCVSCIDCKLVTSYLRP